MTSRNKMATEYLALDPLPPAQNPTPAVAETAALWSQSAAPLPPPTESPSSSAESEPEHYVQLPETDVEPEEAPSLEALAEATGPATPSAPTPPGGQQADTPFTPTEDAVPAAAGPDVPTPLPSEWTTEDWQGYNNSRPQAEQQFWCTLHHKKRGYSNVQWEQGGWRCKLQRSCKATLQEARWAVRCHVCDENHSL